VEIFDVRLLGVSQESAQKLLLTLILFTIVYVLHRVLRAIAWFFIYNRSGDQVRFWLRQLINGVLTLVLLLGTMSIWFEQPDRLAAALGIITVAVGFALQRVILAIAGYFVILQGKTFRIGERVEIGDVRGDVIAIGFVHTTLMEMGDPAKTDVPGGWVRSRQYTGRVISVSNAKIFDDSVHNFTRDFPYVWEEISVPVTYDTDRARAEQILLEAADRHTVKLAEIGAEALATMQRRYFVRMVDFAPRVYYRITDNWLELTVRFLVRDREIRDLKDAVSRDILAAFDEAEIGIASATYDIVGVPPLRFANGARAAGSSNSGGTQIPEAR
jgi:small-conductance mechanosensitive channel